MHYHIGIMLFIHPHIKIVCPSLFGTLLGLRKEYRLKLGKLLNKFRIIARGSFAGF